MMPKKEKPIFRSMQEGLFQIPLRKNGVVIDYALVSPQHYSRVSKYTWYKRYDGYVQGTVDGELIRLHKYIMCVLGGHVIKKGNVIDHCPPENNPLDNRVEKLRVITKKQNGRNKRKRKPKSSEFVGVSKKKNKFEANITVDGKQHYLGGYATQEAAAIARDTFVKNMDDSFGFNQNIDNPGIVVESTLRPRKKYIGVSREPGRPYYRTKLMINGVTVMDHTSRSDIECARAYDQAIVDNELDKQMNFRSEYPDYVPAPVIVTPKVDIDETRCSLVLTNMSRGTVIIDISSYDRVKYDKIHVNKQGYVIIRKKKEKKSYKLHRYLMNETDEDVLIDHRDSEPLNNVMSNLRHSNSQRNAENKVKRAGKSSDFTGVRKEGRKYRSAISNKEFGLKYTAVHDDEISAARDRDLVAIDKLPGTDYKLNFKWTDEDLVHWRHKLRK